MVALLEKLLGNAAIRSFVAALLATPAVKQLLKDLVVVAVAEIFHRRANDPDYLAKSNAAFDQLRLAKTEEEEANAVKAIRSLASGDGL